MGKRPWGDGQLDLFGEREVGADPELEKLAAGLPPGVRLGTSSWTFPGWVGLVYRQRYTNKAAFTRNSLAEYARHPLFGTVGIDRSFYAPLSADELSAYAEQLPRGFRCAMKVWSDVSTRVFSHGPKAGTVNPHFLDPDIFLEAVHAPVEASFAEFMGPFIVEVPPAPGKVNPTGFAKRVAHFLDAIAQRAQISFELRDERLLSREYFEVIRDLGAVHVYNYWSAMPPLVAQRALSGPLWGPLVVRLMIPPGKRYGDFVREYEPFDRLVRPQPQMREQTVALIREAVELGHEAYVIVNNKAEGCSVLTVRELARML